MSGGPRVLSNSTVAYFIDRLCVCVCVSGYLPTNSVVKLRCGDTGTRQVLETLKLRSPKLAACFKGVVSLGHIRLLQPLAPTSALSSSSSSNVVSDTTAGEAVEEWVSYATGWVIAESCRRPTSSVCAILDSGRAIQVLDRSTSNILTPTVAYKQYPSARFAESDPTSCLALLEFEGAAFRTDQVFKSSKSDVPCTLVDVAVPKPNSSSPPATSSSSSTAPSSRPAVSVRRHFLRDFRRHGWRSADIKRETTVDLAGRFASATRARFSWPDFCRAEKKCDRTRARAHLTKFGFTMERASRIKITDPAPCRAAFSHPNFGSAEAPSPGKSAPTKGHVMPALGTVFACCRFFCAAPFLRDNRRLGGAFRVGHLRSTFPTPIFGAPKTTARRHVRARLAICGFVTERAPKNRNPLPHHVTCRATFEAPTSEASRRKLLQKRADQKFVAPELVRDFPRTRLRSAQTLNATQLSTWRGVLRRLLAPEPRGPDYSRAEKLCHDTPVRMSRELCFFDRARKPNRNPRTVACCATFGTPDFRNVEAGVLRKRGDSRSRRADICTRFFVRFRFWPANLFLEITGNLLGRFVSAICARPSGPDFWRAPKMAVTTHVACTSPKPVFAVGPNQPNRNPLPSIVLCTF